MPEAFHLLQKGKLFTRLKFALSKKNYEEGKIFFGEGKKFFPFFISRYLFCIFHPLRKRLSARFWEPIFLCKIED